MQSDMTNPDGFLLDMLNHCDFFTIELKKDINLLRMCNFDY